MPRSRSRRDMNLLQAILDTEGFGEGEHPGSDSTLNTTSSLASNHGNMLPAPRKDPLDAALQQKHRELQRLLWQQHVERQVLMQRQALQQQFVLQRASYPQRRGRRGRQPRGPVYIPYGPIPPPTQPHHTMLSTRVTTPTQQLRIKVESSTQTTEAVTSSGNKEKEDKMQENKTRNTSHSGKESDEDAQMGRKSHRRDKETLLKLKNQDKKEKGKMLKQENRRRKRVKNSGEILPGEPGKLEGETKVSGKDENETPPLEPSSLRMSKEEEKSTDDHVATSEASETQEGGHQEAESHSESNKLSAELGDKNNLSDCYRDHHHGDHHHGNNSLDNNNSTHHGDGSTEKGDHRGDHCEVKGHPHGDRQDAGRRGDESASDAGRCGDESESESEYSDSEKSYSSYSSDSFSSSDESGSGKGSLRSGSLRSEEGTAKKVTFAEEGDDDVNEDNQETSAEKKEEPTNEEKREVKDSAVKRKKGRQASAGRRRTSTHPQFTVTSLSSRYLSLVSSLIELQLSPQPPGKERPRTLSFPGKNISAEILKERAKEDKKKRRMERKLEEQTSPREKKPFQPSDHDLKNSTNPQVQEWLQKKHVEQRRQRREERTKRRLKFQMKIEERDLKIARMIESDEKVEEWMREKRKLLRRKPQKPRRTAVVQPSVMQQQETEETTPLSNSNQGQPDLPTLEKQAAQMEEKLLKDVGADKVEKGQGDTTKSSSGNVGNTTTLQAGGRVAGVDSFARRTVPVGQATLEKGPSSQRGGKIPNRPMTAPPPRSTSPTKRRGKSIHPVSARSRGSKASTDSSVPTSRSVGSASSTPCDPMRSLSYDQWLVHKRNEDQKKKVEVQNEEADPELQSIIPELARRRIEQATMRKMKLDTGLKKKNKEENGKENATNSQDNKPKFIWRLKDDSSLERPLSSRAGSRSPSPGKRSPSPQRPTSPLKGPRPTSPLKEPSFYKRQRFSKEKMRTFTRSMDIERPEPQGSDCPDVTLHDSSNQSQSRVPALDQSEKGATEGVTNSDQSQSRAPALDQSEKGTTEEVTISDQSEKGTTEEVTISDQSEGRAANKFDSDQSAPTSGKAGQSVNSLFAALGISDEIEENIESEISEDEKESEETEGCKLSTSQTFITTVAEAEDSSHA